MSEGEVSQPKTPGVVYGYIESLKAALPEGNQVIIELNFRKDSHDISSKREGDLFIVNRRLRLPVHLKYDETNDQIQEKYILLKLYRITNEGERRQFGDFRINLQNIFKPESMEVKSEEVRAKMSNKPILTFSFATYFKSDPIPQEMSSFTYEKRHSESNQNNDDEKTHRKEKNHQENTNENDSDSDSERRPMERQKSQSRVLHLVNDSDNDNDGDLSKSFMGNSFVEDSSDSFDEDITAQAIQLASQSSDLPKIDEFIVRTWFDLSKSKIGEPGYLLSKKIVDHKGKVLTSAIDRVFMMLEDVRTTTKNEDSAIYFFSSTLTFYQSVKNYPEISGRAQDLCYAAMDTAASIVCPFLKKAFQNSLQLEVGSQEFNKVVEKVKTRMEKYNSVSLKYLLDFIYDKIDCILSNALITDKMFSKIGEIVKANSAISDFETQLKTQFNRFRQVILTVIANDTILSNPESCKDLVPLVTPTFIFFIYCMIKPDETLPKAIDYQKIENFARKMNVNFQTNLSEEMMFKSIKKPLPTSCPEFKFS
ncbi:hypothetical protein TRFO_19551 [Tritrichomonas foetus]|uniref:C2 NT-type domain-containing protein n=1 Tax=Tritrichomonas foetus TaxID=1144522 RepID=A0A1J4KIR7_9EUKA|nr:hypothetical protein TRFO_19551 [Tritrichomonas foetus]|eukprot:OHT10970.1 hypothetical protein TRFO_19551 [Tritrichomonas foetus]